jgi:calcium binding protein 39
MLQLLGELLLDRANFNIMTRYISDQSNLKLMMTLLRDKSRNIQFEAFHVFKVFVANPNKPPPILHILVKNRDKLVAFLNNFHNDKGMLYVYRVVLDFILEDDQFNDEKAFLLKQIQQLPANA